MHGLRAALALCLLSCGATAGTVARGPRGRPAVPVPRIRPLSPAETAFGLREFRELPRLSPTGFKSRLERFAPSLAAFAETLLPVLPDAAQPADAGLARDSRELGRPFDQTGIAPAAAEPVAPDAAEADAVRREPKPTGPSATADDGGGPDYPHRILLWGKLRLRSLLFRPNFPVEPELVKVIDAAQSTVFASLYEFKSKPVLEALRRAKKRGVKVEAVLDYKSVYPWTEPDDEGYVGQRSNEIWALLREGFDVKVLRGFGEFGIMHQKLLLVDADEEAEKKKLPPLAFFGSYNVTWTAENTHYENAHFTIDRKRIDALLRIWKWTASQAQSESLAEGYKWPDAPPPQPPELDFFAAGLTVDLNGTKLPMVFASPQRSGKTTEDWFEAAADAVIAMKDSDDRRIDVNSFAIRSTRIAEALAKAKRAGVRVRVIHDESQAASDAFGPYAQWLAAQGVEVRTMWGPDRESPYPRAQKDHNKVALFGRSVVWTGSPNFTKYAAISNFEIGHFLDDEKDVAGYQKIFEYMWKKAEPLVAGTPPSSLPTDRELEDDARTPARARTPEPPPPEPPNRPTARQLSWRGRLWDAVIMRPDKPVEPEINELLRRAKRSVHLSLYEFDLESVMESLRWLKANQPGVKIQLVVDRSHVYTTGTNSRGEERLPSPQIQALIREGFDLEILKGKGSGIMHSKFLLVDAEADGLMMTGSYNLTEKSENDHFENVVFSNQRGDLDDFLADFQFMRRLSQPVDRKKLEALVAQGQSAAEALDASLKAKAEPDIESAEKPPVTPETFTYNGRKFRRNYFSPQGGVLGAWLNAIDAAEQSIYISMFGFYSREAAEALVLKLTEARKRNPDFAVQLALDAGQSTLARIDGVSVNQWFAERGVDIVLVAGPDRHGDPFYQKLHSKYIVIDGKLVITGSFNLSDNAENFSFENATVIMDLSDVAMYVWDFARLRMRGWKPRPRTKHSKVPEFA